MLPATVIFAPPLAPEFVVSKFTFEPLRTTLLLYVCAPEVITSPPRVITPFPGLTVSAWAPPTDEVNETAELFKVPNVVLAIKVTAPV